jgi:glycerol-3-phosphate acyltransferase PlsX
MTTILLDAMGGDYGPAVTVPGALAAAAEGIDVIVMGDEAKIRAELGRHQHQSSGPTLRVVDAGLGLANEISRTRGTDPFMMAIFDYASNEAVDAVVSMGSTGAVMAAALRVLGHLDGVRRPALAVVLPNQGTGSLLLDVGASSDVRPRQYLDLALLGSVYMSSIIGIDRPRVGLLSIGEEPNKGSMNVVNAHKLLAANAAVRFIGNLEGWDLLSDRADVIVTDGFTGNVVAKLIEGLAHQLFGAFEQVLSDELPAAEARRVNAALEPRQRSLSMRHRGAVPLLGVNGTVLVGHGSGDSEAVKSALIAAKLAVDARMLERFRVVFETAGDDGA